MKKAAIILGTVLSMVSVSVVGLCQTPDELVEQGKELLVKNNDVYAADAKFAQALAADPAYQKANFWRAITVSATSPQLKQMLKDLGILSDDGNDDLLMMDKEGRGMYTSEEVGTVIIDNNDLSLGYSEAGSGWESVSESDDKNYDPYDDNCRRHAAGAGSSKATWTFNVPTTGDYEVKAWWPYASDNAPDAAFTISYGGTTNTITKDQRYSCGTWALLGKYRFNKGQQAIIELSDQASSGYVIADAIRLEYTGVLLKDDAPDAAFTGNWQTVSGYGRDGNYKEIEAGSGGSCTWTLSVPDDEKGRYEVDALYISGPSNSANAVYEIRVNGTLVETTYVNQQKNSHHSLTLCDVNAETNNTISVTLLQNANGKVTTDGVDIKWKRSFPDLTQGQAVFIGMLTQIDEALGYLNNVTNTFGDTLDAGAADNYGNSVLTEIDYGDVLMLKGMLNAFKAFFNITAAYNLDNTDAQKLVFTYEDLLSVNYILNTYLNLGTPMSDAALRLPTAKAAFIESINKYLEGYDFINAETDEQTDDFITFPAEDKKDVSFFNSELKEISDNLNGLTPYYTFVTADFDDYQPSSGGEAAYIDLDMNLRCLFDDPKNFRAFLPQFDENDIPLRATTPDPALGGVLPNMTREELDGIYGLGSHLDSQVHISWNGDTPSVTLAWGKDSYSDFVSYKLYRSDTPDVNELSLKVYETTNKDTKTFTDAALDPNQRVYYYRLYTYYSNGDKITSLVMRVVLKIYVDVNAGGEEEDGSLEKPYKSLEYGLGNALYGTKVLVAKGTYQESNRELYIGHRDGLILEGGYNPVDWTRNIQANETIIDGAGLSGNLIQASYNSDLTIDGFTISGAGAGSHWEAGINLDRSSSVKVRNCKLINNQVGISIYQSSDVLVENCYIGKNTYYGIGFSDNSSAIIKNNIIESNGESGINCWNGYNSTLSVINNTILNNKGAGGIYYQNMASTEIRNNIIFNNNGGWGNCGIYGSGAAGSISHNNSYGHASNNYYNCGTEAGKDNNISADPLFVTAPDGNYYLSQIAAGQAANSPSVDSGSDRAENLGLEDRTTRIDKVTDADTVDMGYHYQIDHSPQLDPIGNKTVQENEKLEFTVSAQDQEGDILAYSVQNLPEGATFTNQTFTWTPTYSQAGAYSVTFTVYDGSLSDTETITITVNNLNRAPVLDSIGNKTVSENQALTFTISATDPDDDRLSYQASNLPEGAAFDTNTQTLSWTPTYSQAGAYSVTFTVSDGSLSDTETITITVNNVNTPPILNTIGSKTVNENSTLVFTISATDPDGDAVSYYISGLPEFATYDSSTHTITWTPNYWQASAYSVTFTVSDGLLSDTETITITVNNVNQTPQITSMQGTKICSVGQLATVNVWSYDPDGEKVKLVLIPSPKHPNASLSDWGNGTGTLYYRPTPFQKGVHRFICRVIDPNGAKSDAYHDMAVR